jgi:hypothetical protein
MGDLTYASVPLIISSYIKLLQMFITFILMLLLTYKYFWNNDCINFNNYIKPQLIMDNVAAKKIASNRQADYLII